MKQQGGNQHCTRNIPWRWSSVWPKYVGWHNRRRHSNVLKSDCVLTMYDNNMHVERIKILHFLLHIKLAPLKYIILDTEIPEDHRDSKKDIWDRHMAKSCMNWAPWRKLKEVTTDFLRKFRVASFNVTFLEIFESHRERSVIRSSFYGHTSQLPPNKLLCSYQQSWEGFNYEIRVSRVKKG